MAATRQTPMRAVKENKPNGTTNAAVDAVDPTTDFRRWRLLDEGGRHTWHYLSSDAEVEAWPQTLADKYFLGLPIVSHKRLAVLPPASLEICSVVILTSSLERALSTQS